MPSEPPRGPTVIRLCLLKTAIEASLRRPSDLPVASLNRLLTKSVLDDSFAHH